MSSRLRDRLRLPRRAQIKIDVERTKVGRLHVRECQVHQGLRFAVAPHQEANLTVDEVRSLAAWLTGWADSQEGGDDV